MYDLTSILDGNVSRYSLKVVITVQIYGVPKTACFCSCTRSVDDFKKFYELLNLR